MENKESPIWAKVVAVAIVTPVVVLMLLLLAGVIRMTYKFAFGG